MSEPLGISITIPQSPLFEPGAARDLLIDALSAAVDDLLAQMHAEAWKNTPTGLTGQVRDSIMTCVVRGADASELVHGALYSDNPIMLYLEEGTRPHMPPVEPIKPWAAQFLGDPQLAWAVAMAIARRGTPARHIFADALAEVEPTIVPTVQAAVDQVIAQLNQ
jgi:hypothetical protein